MSDNGPSVHASAVRVGSRAVLIGDDRVHLAILGDEIEVRPAAGLAGLIEIRGLGIRHCDFVEHATVGLVVDLDANDAERLPAAEALKTSIFGVEIPRIPVGRGYSPLPLVVGALTTTKSSSSVNPSGDCLKGNGNHMNPTIATEHPLLRGGSGWSKWRVRAVHQKRPRGVFR